MGPLLVTTMVQEGIVEAPAKKLHPFFTKGPNDLLKPKDDIESPADNGEASGGADGPRKRRKLDSVAKQDENRPKKRGRPRRSAEATPEMHTIAEPAKADEAAPESNANDFPTPPLSDIAVMPTDQPQPESNAASNPPPSATLVESAMPQTPPKNKKVLKFNPKTGTLGSPPKSKRKETPSRIVSIKYGRDESTRKEVGEMITQILDGKLQLPKTPTKQRAARGPKKSNEPTSTLAVAPKLTHPFFTGKPIKKAPSAEQPSAVHEKPRSTKHSVFMSTPVSPKKPRAPFIIDKVSQFGSHAGGLKIPGAMHPLWPPRDMSHIRGLEPPASILSTNDNDLFPSRKSKGSIVTVSPHEAILSRFTERMDLEVVRNNLPRDEDNFTPAPPELRLPVRHFESGRKLQQRIRSQLRTYRPEVKLEDVTGSQDEFIDGQSRRHHLAIKQLYDSLETQLSAYDRSTCESLSWAQKYAPVTAAHILQAGKEGPLLREWLEALKVQSVDTGSSEGKGGKGKAKTESAPKKRRKKNKMDDFIVDSDEEANEMDEVSENEEDWAPAGPGSSKKTVIRNGDAAAKGCKDKGRLTNAVVISGPHGSGKTATVFAAAKELGFEVFEINSSTRRSGKDILEKVGDMTQNHLVQRHRADQASEENAEDEVARDIKSGKQGMMTAFFKPKSTPSMKKPSKSTKAVDEDKPTEAIKNSSTKSQKQSLILIEEVDIIYEEDKQFWASLMAMMAQSKRPFIMTCNDESLVPLRSLNLHGIFRFSPPPTDLAVDLCLLVAANEGHALQRSAVEALYCSRGYDLRATLTELNYWCQLGVGDRKGGFDWFYLRWPKGTDLDENGDVVRVISEDTYKTGMGWVSRDLIATCPDALESEEEVLHQAWDSWRTDISNWHSSVDVESWATSLTESALVTQNRRHALAAYDEFCDAMSAADLCAAGCFGLEHDELLDPTLPEMPTKAKDDFIIGRTLLEADPRSPAFSPQRAMALTLKSFARDQLLQASPSPGDVIDKTPLMPVTENKAISILDAYFHSSSTMMTRMDLAFAFDPIAVNEKATPSTHLDPSVFDRTLKLIVSDVAPWVRGIVAYDHELMLERRKLSNLLSEGGKRKRMRTTRAAYSALEGRERKTTRREKYFGDCLTTGFIMRTGGDKWQDAIKETTKVATDEASIRSTTPSEGSVDA